MLAWLLVYGKDEITGGRFEESFSLIVGKRPDGHFTDLKSFSFIERKAMTIARLDEKY